MDITFLIPVRIDSDDRHRNAIKSLNYLCNYAPHKILIIENDSSPKIPNILDMVNKNGADIDYMFVQDNQELFHKTKFLNMMLKKASTKVVVNYDIDILLHPKAYGFCYDLIVDKGYHLVYPYGNGDFLLNVFPEKTDKIKIDWTKLDNKDFLIKICKHGLCQFLHRETYINYGGMNENFISYGPEDYELGYRFQKFKLKIQWINTYIIHLDHHRGINSSDKHTLGKSNYQLFDYLQKLNIDQLKEYYNVQDTTEF